MDVTQYLFNSDEKKDYYFALVSDVHIDSKNFAAEQFHADMKKYLSHDARIYINGDLFDAILPSDRKRYTRGNDGFGEDAQINERIEKAFETLKPYVNNIDFIGIGNHEASVVKYDSVDMIKMLVRELSHIRDPKLPPIQRGSYQGYLLLRFTGRGGKDVRNYHIYRDHGKGGNSPVTKGTIGLNRIHTTFIADLYWLGHTHSNIVDGTTWTIYPNQVGRIIKKKKRSVITAGYQDSFMQRDIGPGESYRNAYDEERFLTPSGIGSALLRITVPKDANKMEVESEVIA